MLKKYATVDQIELLRYRFFHRFTTSSMHPLDLAYSLWLGLSERYGYNSSYFDYPMQLDHYISLLRHDEAEYILRCLAAFSDVFLVWDKYTPYNGSVFVDYVLTKPDPDTGYAIILHKDQDTGLLWLDYSEAETDHFPDDTAILSIKTIYNESKLL